MRYFFCAYYFVCSVFLHAQVLRIGLLSHKKINQFYLHVAQGAYYVPELDIEIIEGDNLRLELSQKKIQVRYKAKTYKKLSQITFENNDESSAFLIEFLTPDKTTPRYYGDLIVTVQDTCLQLINLVELQDYLEGVIQAEAGFGHELEFYKAQSVISRTYALKNGYKHQKQGFYLCDGVHCQSYKGKIAEYPLITQAVQATQDWVLVDKKSQLIDALYHANSGGETVHSEDYWSESKEYLRGVKDEFSIGQPNYQWEKRVNKKEFYKYLFNKFNLDNPTAFLTQIIQPQNKRTTHFSDALRNIPLKSIRSDWNLRSTFFHVHDLGDELLFLGKGYGHGVGLSQEGAMNMANKGYSFQEILNYYYKNTQITKIQVPSFDP